jgi:hypothetical protein
MDFKDTVIDKLREFKQELKEYENIGLAKDEIKNIEKKIDQTYNEIEELDINNDVNDNVKQKFEDIYTKEIPDLFVKLNDTLEQIQKNGPIPRLNTTKNIAISNIYTKIKRIIDDKNLIYQNIDQMNNDTGQYGAKEMKNIDITHKGIFKFNYMLDDYIIFKENTKNDYTIGKIILMFGRGHDRSKRDNTNFTSLYIKYIEPMNILLNPGILYWVNIAEKKVADIFVNNYELMTIEDQKYSVFPLQLFCNINDNINIKTKLDEIFDINDEILLKLDYNNISIQEQVNIKSYFNVSLPFYGILDDLIDNHFNRYIEISNDFFKDKSFNAREKNEIIQFLNHETSHDDNNVIGGSLEFKEKYLKLVKEMPIKLIPNVPK